jgi:hypothetical protein
MRAELLHAYPEHAGAALPVRGLLGLGHQLLINDGAKGGPAVVGTQVVPLRSRVRGSWVCALRLPGVMTPELHERIAKLDGQDARRVLHLLVEEDRCDEETLVATLARIERENRQQRLRDWSW